MLGVIPVTDACVVDSSSMHCGALPHMPACCAARVLQVLGVGLQEKAEAGFRGRATRMQASLAHLDAMNSAIAAAQAFSDADCCFAAVQAAQTAIALGQQLQAPPK